jgi:Cu+-exporting ATPase
VILHGYELIPCDSTLLSDHALIDYSFVTGESKPTAVSQGQVLHAGGKLLGQAIQIEITSPVSQSYLTSLWNHQKKTSEKTPKLTWVDQWAQHFTWFLLLLSLLSGLYWWTLDPQRAVHAVSTILIVACPCALLLSATFTQGAVLLHLYQVGCYVKNNRVLHQLARIDHLAWDKTGTLTSKEAQATWLQQAPSSHHPAIVALCSQSVHPLSQSVVRTLRNDVQALPTIEHFREHIGSGIEGIVNGIHYQIGSAAFTGHPDRTVSVVIYANQECIGTFSMTHPIRPLMAETLHSLASEYRMSVISGDPLPTTPEIRSMIPQECPIFHGLSPQEKKQHILQLSEHHPTVAMIGDGLNDAGALESATVGIAITEKSHPFSPACDVMLDAQYLPLLPAILEYAQRHEQIVKWSFGISLLYNLIGLSFAVSGTLHPLIAAILMPISSITIMLFTTGMAYCYRPQNARKILVS